MSSIKYIATFFLAFLAVGLWAQPPGEDLNTQDVEVVKNFDARLLNTNRIILPPGLPPLDTVIRSQQYTALDRPLSVNYLPPKIRPLAIRGDRLQKTYKGYAKLGAGLPAAAIFDAAYHSNVGENFDFQLDAYHHSANNNAKVENQRFADNRFGAEGTYYFEPGFAVQGRLGYTRDIVHFYGYNDLNAKENTNFTFDTEDIRQRFSIFDIGGSTFNGVRTKADFNYDASIDLYLLEDNYATRENGLKLSVSGTKWFEERHALTVGLRTDFTNLKDNGKQDLNNFHLSPSYTYRAEAFTAKIGGRLATSDDNFFFFPDLELSASVLGDLLNVYVGATGDLEKNSFRSLSTYNPFIESRIEIKNSVNNHYYGGIRGTYRGFDYDAQLGYQNVDDLALFTLSDFNDSIPRFDVLYDTASIFSIKGSISADVIKDLSVVASLAQQVIKTDREEKAWHLPSTAINVGARYTTLEGKAVVKADFFLENGVPFKKADGTADNLNALFDISLGADYYFTENFGAFIQVNNLANNKRQRWHRYPVLGLNMQVGVSARF